MSELNHLTLIKKINYLKKNRGFKELEILIEIWLQKISINENINNLELIIKILEMDDYLLYKTILKTLDLAVKS